MAGGGGRKSRALEGIFSPLSVRWGLSLGKIGGGCRGIFSFKRCHDEIILKMSKTCLDLWVVCIYFSSL